MADGLNPAAERSSLAVIRLLGGFAAWRSDGSRVPGLGRRSVALLACLAVADKPWPRDELASLVWDGRGLEQMRGSLRQELARLRRAFGWDGAGRDAPKGTISLPSALAEIDVIRFQHALGDPSRLAEAAELYRGPLLHGFATERQDAFTKWLLGERARLQAAALDAMLRLLRSGEGSDTLAERILALDPACEEAHRFLMRHYAAQGALGKVRAQFQACAQALRATLGIEPSAATRSLVEETGLAPGAPPPAPALAPGESTAAALAWIRNAPGRAPVPTIPDPQTFPPIEDKPSVAVLPFRALGPDGPVDDLLASGLTEEVTQALARMPGFFVTARQSAMAYRGRGTDPRRIAAELGVRYLVEGSLERDGRRMRIEVRLLNGRSGLPLWADTQTGALRDVIAVRDAMVHRLASRLQPQLILAEIQHALRRPLEDPDAWTWLQRANGALLGGRSRVSLTQVVEPLQRALAIDPHYAMAHALLAAVYTWRALSLLSDDPQLERQLAQQHADAALNTDPENPFVLVHCAESAIYSAADIDAGLSMLSHAIDRDPNDAHGLAMLGHVKRFVGEDPRASLALIGKAFRLSPRDPRTFNWHHYANWCHWRLGDFASMEAETRRSIELYGQNAMSWIALTGTLALQERLAEAREAAAVLRQQRPGFTPDGFYEVSRRFYGRRFEGGVQRDYHRLCMAMARVW